MNIYYVIIMKIKIQIYVCKYYLHTYFYIFMIISCLPMVGRCMKSRGIDKTRKAKTHPYHIRFNETPNRLRAKGILLIAFSPAHPRSLCPPIHCVTTQFEIEQQLVERERLTLSSLEQNHPATLLSRTLCNRE